MEHTARLAVLEQKFKFSAAFQHFLQALLKIISSALKDGEHCRIRMDSAGELSSLLQVEGAMEYLNYLGFEVENGFLTLSNTQKVNNLSSAKNAIEAKLQLFVASTGHGAIKKTTIVNSTKSILMTENPFLRQIERHCQHVMRYEVPLLLNKARKCIPLVTLQVRAMARIRTQQRSIKRGSDETEQTFEMALLSELVSWFKTSFFSWVDEPSCPQCEGAAVAEVSRPSRQVNGEMCVVEIYECKSCSGKIEFVRYKDPERLLSTRQGRCGEWANCFTLLCRALGLEARYVIDTTDHAWSEVYEPSARRWVHVDPCEAATDSPLLYEHGWGKKLQYVIAYSHDDVQDVTWRYSGHHSEVRKRRNKCKEWELLDALMALRESKQRHLSAARQKYLQRRTVTELAEMLVERKPSDYENKGRFSGSEKWRSQRGETGDPRSVYKFSTRHVFKLDKQGTHDVAYCPVKDRYRVSRGATGEESGDSGAMEWLDGVWECDNIRRHVENDWKMVYLARCDGNIPGQITWRFEAEDGLTIQELTINQTSHVFGDGLVEWSMSVDEREFQPLHLQALRDGAVSRVSPRGRGVAVRATLSRGAGDIAWQQAQLFRAPLNSTGHGLRVSLGVASDEQ